MNSHRIEKLVLLSILKILSIHLQSYNSKAFMHFTSSNLSVSVSDLCSISEKLSALSTLSVHIWVYYYHFGILNRAKLQDCQLLGFNFFTAELQLQVFKSILPSLPLPSPSIRETELIIELSMRNIDGQPQRLSSVVVK